MGEAAWARGLARGCRASEDEAPEAALLRTSMLRMLYSTSRLLRASRSLSPNELSYQGPEASRTVLVVLRSLKLSVKDFVMILPPSGSGYALIFVVFPKASRTALAALQSRKLSVEMFMMILSP